MKDFNWCVLDELDNDSAYGILQFEKVFLE